MFKWCTYLQPVGWFYKDLSFLKALLILSINIFEMILYQCNLYSTTPKQHVLRCESSKLSLLFRICMMWYSLVVTDRSKDCWECFPVCHKRVLTLIKNSVHCMLFWHPSWVPWTVQSVGVDMLSPGHRSHGPLAPFTSHSSSTLTIVLHRPTTVLLAFLVIFPPSTLFRKMV